MRPSIRILTLIAAMTLPLCGCNSERPKVTDETSASTMPAVTVSAFDTVPTDAVTSTTAAKTPPSVTEPPAAITLTEGMLIYTQDFDDFTDSALLAIDSLKALEWASGGTARFAIHDHRLYFENIPKEGKKQADTVCTLGEAIPKELFEHPFTAQYDITYTAGESGATAGAASPDAAPGLPDASLLNTCVTVRLRWEPGVGYTVWQRPTAGGQFVKTGEPATAACSQICIFFGAANGYLDNIRIWVGHGDTPDANVPCYWQAVAEAERSAKTEKEAARGGA